MKNIYIYDFLTKLKIVPDVTEIITIKTQRKIYKVITPTRCLRLDINQPLGVNEIQKMAYESKVNVPKIFERGVGDVREEGHGIGCFLGQAVLCAEID